MTQRKKQPSHFGEHWPLAAVVASQTIDRRQMVRIKAVTNT
jgi:hypothetical protein